MRNLLNLIYKKSKEICLKIVHPKHMAGKGNGEKCTLKEKSHEMLFAESYNDLDFECKASLTNFSQPCHVYIHGI